MAGLPHYKPPYIHSNPCGEVDASTPNYYDKIPNAKFLFYQPYNQLLYYSTSDYELLRRFNNGEISHYIVTTVPEFHRLMDEMRQKKIITMLDNLK